MSLSRLSSVAAALALLLVPATALAEVCGDGLRGFFEACDDGNTRNGDGCSSTCTVETGYTCGYANPQRVELKNPGFESGLDATNWQVIAGGVDWLTAGYLPCFPAGEGTSSVDLSSTVRGAIAQSFKTIKGEKYSISFLGNANCKVVASDSCTATCARTIAFGVADVVTSSLADDAKRPFKTGEITLHGAAPTVPWQVVHFDFIAQSSNTLIYFAGSDPSAAGPMIDDVRIPVDACRLSTCGDGELDPGEACDDGNKVSGDGCTGDCAFIENTFVCSTPGMPCTTVCGNGQKANSEQCDDGNTLDGDGCDHACALEPYARCSTVPPDLKSTCTCAGKPGYGADCKDIDECARGVGGDATKTACGANQACTNTPGSYACTCNAGYKAGGTADPNGKVDCVDVDECAATPAPCVADAICTNKPGGATCACKPGYSGNGVDSCVKASCFSTDDCPANSVCSAADDPRNPGGIRICGCNVDFEPDPNVKDKLSCRPSSKAASKCTVVDVGGPAGSGALAIPAVALALGLARRARRLKRAQR